MFPAESIVTSSGLASPLACRAHNTVPAGSALIRNTSPTPVAVRLVVPSASVPVNCPARKTFLAGSVASALSGSGFAQIHCGGEVAVTSYASKQSREVTSHRQKNFMRVIPVYGPNRAVVQNPTVRQRPFKEQVTFG